MMLLIREKIEGRVLLIIFWTWKDKSWSAQAWSESQKTLVNLYYKVVSGNQSRPPGWQYRHVNHPVKLTSDVLLFYFLFL